MLHEGEEVRFLTHGTSHTLLEAYFMGWLLYYKPTLFGNTVLG